MDTTQTTDSWGYLRLRLGNPPKITPVSHSLTVLLGEEDYLSRIHPEDRQTYLDFLARMGSKPGTQTLNYRLRYPDGSFLWVKDRLTSWQEPGGELLGESLIFRSRQEPEVPWGILRCTCEKQPRITFLNRAMRELLRLPLTREGEEDYLALYRENIFLMLPIEERRRFARYLEQMEDAPVFGEMALLRCDGTRAHVFGWVTKTGSEFQAVCLDVTEYYQSRKERATLRYLNALKDVYDKIFQYDLGEGILTCLYDSTESRFRWLGNIPMQLEEATEKWVTGTVVPEEQQKVLEFFRDYHRTSQSDGKPPRITYHARSSTGEIRAYSGIFLRMEGSTSLYCCRRLPDLGEADRLRTENDSLRENMQEMMMQFSDGIAAFQVADGAVTPLYITENICQFFGRTREEWLPMMKKATPIRDFVSRSAVDYARFEALLRDGEAEFTYEDLQTHRQQRMKAICSHKSPQAPRYVMLYRVEDTVPEAPHVRIRTFGYFDVFVDDNPIAFRNRKSKELFALLVDRRGGFVSSEEAIGYLWEEEPVSSVTLARYRKVALRLKNLLAEYGISDILETVDGKRRIVPQKVCCDLYDYLSGREEYAQLFKGSYLTNYSWGEITLAELSGATLC